MCIAGYFLNFSFKYLFAQTLSCEESQRNIAETRLHPIKGIMKLRAVIPLSNGGTIAVQDTSCICRQCYNDGLTGGLNTH